MTEAQAIRAAKRGNAQGLSVLYEMHRDHVYAKCLSMVRDPYQAEDLTQETFILVLRYIKGFAGDSKFSTWLHRVAVNVVLMWMRKNKSRMVALHDSLTQEGEEPVFELQNDMPSEKTLNDRIDLEKALKALSPGYRRCVVLHDIQGYQHNEIGAILGTTPGNSKSQLHKGRRKLRLRLVGETA